MAIKYREAVDLRMSTKQELTSSSENWLKFLRTASNTYKYNFSDQLLIFAQFPNAKAVAVFDVFYMAVIRSLHTRLEPVKHLK